MFRRGGDLLNPIGIGIRNSINEILGEGKNCISCCVGEVEVTEGSTLTIQVSEGNLVMRSLRRDLLASRLSIKDVVLNVIPPATCTILDEMEKEELYERIRKSYRKIICSIGELDPAHVEKSREYIERLPDHPALDELERIAEEITSGGLEYANREKDEFGVEMGTYARELKERLRIG